MERGLIYFDHAATTFPKPRSVVEAVQRCMTEYGGNAGRGAHRLAMAAAEKIYECRSLLAAHFGVEDPARVLFTLNTTSALNTVMKGLLREGDHVLISDLEHNAVLRPLAKLEEEGKITFSTFPSMAGAKERNAAEICVELAKRITPKTRMVVTTHASNLCSVTMPIREIGALCRRYGLLFVVDAAQSAGHEPISVDAMAIDALCLPSHKGLLGPQGCGVILLGEKVTPEALETLVEGGNGMASLERRMPLVLPERYEAGTLPTPAIAGLCEGVRTVAQLGEESISEHEKMLFRRAREGLGGLRGIQIYTPEDEGGVLLFHVENLPSERVGRLLSEQGICVRCGYHCAPLAHATLGTPDGGAVRVSFGIYNQLDEVDCLARAVRELL